MSERAYQLRYALPIWLGGFLTDWWPDNRVTIRIRGWLYSRFIPRCGRDLVVQRRVTLVLGIEPTVRSEARAGRLGSAH